MKLHRLDHVGINVNDLPAAKAFFLALGMKMEGQANVGGAWVDRVVGLRGVKASIVMMRAPGGGAKIELVKFHRPVGSKKPQRWLANAAGIRHIALLVEDLEPVVARLKKNGAKLVGEIENYENVYKLCYVRGPEGIILELAEEIGAKSREPNPRRQAAGN